MEETQTNMGLKVKLIIKMDLILKYFSDFTELQLSQLKALEHLYKEWNNKINVISRKDMESLYEKHVLHSLSIAAVFNFDAGTEIVDIGTGGGFPGIPLAIFFPEVRFHLVDSIAKKLKIADAISDDIKLKNITTQHIRAEEIKNRKFNFVISRAVAPLNDLWKWSKPLLKNPESRVGSRKSGIISQIAAQNPELISRNSKLLTQNWELYPGLICLKGGNLAQEIQESGTRPHIVEMKYIFQEEFFTEKYILYIPC